VHAETNAQQKTAEGTYNLGLNMYVSRKQAPSCPLWTVTFCTDYLKDYFLRGLVRLQKMAHVEEGMVLVTGLLPLQVIPAKLDELLAVYSHAVGQVSHQQSCHLKQLHVDCI